MTTSVQTSELHCAYTVGGCSIGWTTHAIERVEERFGFSSSIEIPNERIARIHKLVSDGEEFHVKTPLVRFVCKRDKLSDVAVVTVLYAL